MSAETLISASPSDLRTALALAAQIEAQTSLTRAQVWRTRAISGGILVAVIGAATAAGIWAWGQRNPSPEAWQAALDHMPPLKVEMTVDPKATVAIADGGTVALKDGGTVTLKNGGVIDVRLPEIKLPDMSTASARTSDGTAIQREVIVFNSVPGGPGRTVMTGWRYANGAAKIPSSQYCYLDHATLTGGERTDLAFDRRPLPVADAMLLDKCVWWTGGAG